MPERSHLSIGEVLSLLREEFPDVTISKIRFLESQGLVDPERTPSGYRKFYDQDVERLRWILRQQREHFLPLKVIRGRLSEGAEGEANGTGGEHSRRARPDRGDGGEAPHLPGLGPVATTAEPEAPESAKTDVLTDQEAAAPRPRADASGIAPAARAPMPSPAAAGSTEHQVPRTSAVSAAEPATQAPAVQRAAPPRMQPEPTGARAVQPVRSAPRDRDDHESYSADELASAAGATPELVNELKQYGLITVHTVVAGTPYFDETALAVTRAAAGFARHGVEARHLRAWRNAADREASLFEQLIMPLLRQRNPQARRQAADTVTDLSRLGGELRDALLQRALRDIR
jgi:DNA-binding transcriptional MerR regulator